jgi:hypothetical protein
LIGRINAGLLTGNDIVSPTLCPGILHWRCRRYEAMSFFGLQIPPPFAPFSRPVHQMDKYPRGRIERNENEEY